MSASFKIQSASGGYAVHLESGLFEQLLKPTAAEVVIADEWFAQMLSSAKVPAITLRADESMKSLDAVPALIVMLREIGANRQTRLVAVGGGVIQDVATFIASVYMRGVEWVYVPTTLLAMADSCIGGKSSINVGPYKNLVGTFHPPSLISIDPRLTLSLSDEQRVSGLIEAAKICFCRGEASFEEFLAQLPAASMPVERLEKVILASLMAKKWFIETDEFDRGERLVLNFGHTFGHAIEGASQFRIAHGIGVGLGIGCAIELGQLLGRNYGAAPRLQTLEAHLGSLLAGVSHLPNELQSLRPEEILDRFQADKKHGTQSYNVILVSESGAAELVRMPKDESSRRLIETAISKGLRKFC